MPARHANRRSGSIGANAHKNAVSALKPTRGKAVPRVLFFSILAGMLILAIVNIYEYVNRPPKILVIRTDKDNEAFWQNIKQSYPTYKDAYLVLSNIKSEEGDVLSAKDYKDEASKIDPYLESGL